MTWSLQDLGWSDKENRVYYNGVKAKLVNVYKANPADNDLVGEIGLLYIIRKPSHGNQRPSSIRFAFIQEELNKGFFICVLNVDKLDIYKTKNKCICHFNKREDNHRNIIYTRYEFQLL